VVSFTPPPIYAREEARDVKDFRLGGTHIRSESFGKRDKIFCPLPRFKPQFVKLIDCSIPFLLSFGIVQQNYATSANFSIYHVNSLTISATKTYALDKDWFCELTDTINDGVAIWPTCLAL
jgi:hypothetical protein